MEKYNLMAVNLISQCQSELEIEADEGETTDNIILSVKWNGERFTASDNNYLPAFQLLRDHLLFLGYGLKCNGSRLNAVQSGMMGANDKIYLVELGKQALLKDIVSLYEYADIDSFPDTQAQTLFFNQWADSL